MPAHLHIIALNIPYPPNYGGVIDIYYKLTALHRLGVKITLHCFAYDRPPAPQLEALCEQVYYYRRRTGLIANITLLPYNVYSRKNPLLIRRLLQDNHPILFEGLHSCYYLTDHRLHHRLKLYREGNIEHDYYRLLATTCRTPLTRLYLLAEAWRFKRYQPAIAAASRTLAISQADATYLRQQFPTQPVEFLPAFHAAEHITSRPGRSTFILYHGKLSVIENEHAALFLIRQVFSKLQSPCIIAGMNPTKRLHTAAAPWPHITIEANPTEERMNHLTHEAQIHLLVTFQNTGLKLKLLNSLFAGRHIIANHTMLHGSGLDPLCHIADTPEAMTATCRRLLAQPFTTEDIARRQTHLLPAYSPTAQATRLQQWLTESD
jgi:hypothetical protein